LSFSRKAIKMPIAVGIILFHPDAAELARLLRSLPEAIKLYIKWNSRRGSDATPGPMKTAYIDSNTDNMGYGVAHNRLAAQAFADGAEFYLCLNQDGMLRHDAVRNLIEFQDEDSLVELRQFPREHPKPYDPLTGHSPWCSGASLCIPAKIFEKTGGFDPNIFMYCEDVDLSWRARAAGFATKVCHSAVFMHDVREQKSREMVRLMLESARYLAYKWGATEFQAAMERLLVENSFYPETIYLPPLPTVQQLRPRPDQEWRQLLTFALPRWAL
jgi:GT2 family glycosyltransferase